MNSFQYGISKLTKGFQIDCSRVHNFVLPYGQVKIVHPFTLSDNDQSHHRSVSCNLVPIPKKTLEQFVLKCHIGFWLQSDTSAEDVGKGCSLLCKSVDDWSARWRKRSLVTLIHLFKIL